MAKEKMSEVIQGTEKEFLDNFKELCRSRMSWEVWADLMCAMACTISNVADRRRIILNHGKRNMRSA